MNYTERIKKAVENAENRISNLSQDCLSIEGCSSPKIRHLLSNLVQPDDRYLEIGCYKGSTSIAALYPDKPNYYLIDNYSEFNPEEGADKTKEEMISNFTRIIGHPPKNFINEECFSIKPLDHGIKDINVYLYDGGHDIGRHASALIHYYASLADEFIFCVDDWDANWGVRDGTNNAIKELDLKTEYRVELPHGTICDSKFAHTDDQYWFGFAVFHLKK